LKIITLEEDETFDDLAIEISILKMCDHENIVRFYGGATPSLYSFLCS